MYSIEQDGGYLAPYRGVRFQRGGGLGSLFVRMARTLGPVIARSARVGARLAKTAVRSKVGKRLIKEGVRSTKDILRDIGSGKEPKQAVKRRLKEGATRAIAKTSKPLLKKQKNRKTIKRRKQTFRI